MKASLASTTSTILVTDLRGVASTASEGDAAGVIERVGDRRLRLYVYHIPPVSQVPITLPLIERHLDYDKSRVTVIDCHVKGAWMPVPIASTSSSARSSARSRGCCVSDSNPSIFCCTPSS